MDLVSAIEKLLSEHGSANILRDHLALLRDQAKQLENENAKLRKRVTELEQLVPHLTAQIKSKAREEEFVEHEGALFKRRPDGSFHRAVYCPICKSATGAMIPEMPFACRQSCGWVANFHGSDLNRLLTEVAKNA